MNRFSRIAALTLAAFMLIAPALVRAQAEPITEDDVIAGSMNIDFKTRTSLDSSGDLKQGSAAFEKMSGEDAFFAVDNSIPCLTGKIEYADTFISGGTTPSNSKITYHLNANKLNKQQIVNFFKLWMICVGPTNDE